MVLDRFAALLKASMGLDAASVGSSAIERAVRERQQACHLRDRQAYWRRVCESERELQALIDAVVVPETWFFRDPEAFTALGRLLQDGWRDKASGETVRMLSVPCSTGEEPYSMVMALLEGGTPSGSFRVDAVDISERALAYGRLGVYGTSSFRGRRPDLRSRYFEPVAGGHRVCDLLRDHVDFQQGNLLSPVFLPGAAIYDVIFCRNVLIYFDRPTQERAIAVLSRLLKRTGFLFVGSSEAGVLLNHGFAPIKAPMAFAFRRADPAVFGRRRSAAGAGWRAVGVPLRSGLPPPHRESRGPADESATASGSFAPDLTAEEDPGLGEGLRLADQGRFVEAALHCQTHMRRYGPTAEAFHLLGLVRDASGNHDEAATYYRKALYLDPHHQSALLHLALLMEGLDNKAEAELLRARARRAHRRGV
jgi:chemotaxis protein methyltransferase WspC